MSHPLFASKGEEKAAAKAWPGTVQMILDDETYKLFRWLQNLTDPHRHVLRCWKIEDGTVYACDGYQLTAAQMGVYLPDDLPNGLYYPMVLNAKEKLFALVPAPDDMAYPDLDAIWCSTLDGEPLARELVIHPDTLARIYAGLRDGSAVSAPRFRKTYLLPDPVPFYIYGQSKFDNGNCKTFHIVMPMLLSGALPTWNPFE